MAERNTLERETDPQNGGVLGPVKALPLFRRPVGRGLFRLLQLGLGVVALVLLVRVVRALPVELTGFPEALNLHLRVVVNAIESWIRDNWNSHPLFTWLLNPLSFGLGTMFREVEAFVLWLPWQVIVVAAFLVGLRGGIGTSLIAVVSLLYMGGVGLWEQSMSTLSLMAVSIFICLVIGFPLGVLASRSDRFANAIRPVLDTMQTMPAFVYLIPVILVFGTGNVSGAVATIIYATPPIVRLTNLAIRQVPRETVEAAIAFGSKPGQILRKVQIPMALPSIMLGINQTIMMALGIVIIASLIGAGGLGEEILISLNLLEMGRALEAGLAVVFIAILLDRLSYGFSERQDGRRSGRLSARVPVFPERLTHRFRPLSGIETAISAVFIAGRHLAHGVATGVSLAFETLGRVLGRPRTAAEATRTAFQRAAFPLTAAIGLVGLGYGMLELGWQAFPERLSFTFQEPVNEAIRWMRVNLYQIGNLPIGTGPFNRFMILEVLSPLRDFFVTWLPWPLLILGVAGLGRLVGGWLLALFCGLAVFSLGLLGMWSESMNTLSQVIVAVAIAIIVAIPLGILAARSDTFAAVLRPVLDTMQTIPPFVYLVPVVMLFEVGRVPGIMASVIYALPPAARLTNVGIRQISKEIIDAGQAFGSSSRQLLTKVQLPLALPSILLGINQTTMMVLAMVIIAGLIGGGGLGFEAVTGLVNAEVGRGIEAGLAIVLMAMVLDRLIQGWAENLKPGTSSE